MKRKHLIAAELFAYSYDNYANHLAVGNERFTRLMPREAEILEEAGRERWTDERLAKALGVPAGEVPDFRERYRRALEVVDAPTPAASFRRGVRQSVEDAIREGLDSPEAIESLVTQVCYRAADLSYLLRREGSRLSDYSKELRTEPGTVRLVD